MQGSALVLLYPSEETYVDFLAINQKVRLNQMELEVEDKVGFSSGSKYDFFYGSLFVFFKY